MEWKRDLAITPGGSIRKQFNSWHVPADAVLLYSLEDKDVCEISVSAGDFRHTGRYVLTSGKEFRLSSKVAQALKLRSSESVPEVLFKVTPYVRTGPSGNPAAMQLFAGELNRLSSSYAIGSLQQIRRQAKGLVGSSRRSLFDSQTIFADYAYHYGGRSELQFNIGIEAGSLRHGVAFSLEPSQSLPWKEMEKVFIPKIKLFNQFLVSDPESFADMRMWFDANGKRLGPDQSVGPIPWELVKNGVFIFVGKRQPLEDVRYEPILRDFDKLLPLYRYVESGGTEAPGKLQKDHGFDFQPGCTTKKAYTSATPAQQQLDVDLRHHELQEKLYRLLVEQYGPGNVGTEIVSAVGRRVDVVVRESGKFDFYEIKIAGSARACLRLAIGQLLEYSFWPGAQKARRMIVVGESPIDAGGHAYLQLLRDHFSLAVEYRQVTIDSELVT